MKSQQNVVGVQYLRGIAACLVVVDHASTTMALPEFFGRAPAAFLFYGAVGVPIFFVISGFIIAAVSLDRDLKPRLSLDSFYRRRFIRIIPFMWLCIAGYAALQLASKGTLEWSSYVRAMTLWPIGDVRPNVIWTLRHEFLFYALFGFAMLGAVRRTSIIAVWFLSPILLACLRGFWPDILSSLPNAGQQLIAFICNAANVGFGLGFVLGIAYAGSSGAFQARLPGGFAAVVLAACAVFAMLALVMPSWDDPWVAISVSLISALLVWFGISIRPSQSALSRLGHILGDASYAIYLVHLPVLLVLLTLGVRLHIHANPWLIHIALTLAAIIAGWSAHILVERPVVRAANRLFGAKSHASTPVRV